MRVSGQRVMLLALALVLVGGGVPTSLGAPRIVCRERVFEFGAMEASQSVEHSFVIANEGDALLEIGQVRACCGAVASMAALSLPPGSSTVCRVVLSLAGREGRINKKIYVASSDSKESILPLTLVGEVVPPLVVCPRTIDWGMMEAGVATNTRVVIAPRSGVLLTVTNVIVPAGITATYAPGSNGQWLAEVRAQALPVGWSRGEVVFLTDHKEYSRIQVGVIASVQRDLVAVPSEIVLAAADEGANPVVRYVALRSRTGRRFNVLRVQTPHAGITASCQRMTSGGYRITLNGIPASAELDGKSLVVHTDHPQAAIVTIPFVVAGSRGSPDSGRKKAD